MPVCLVGVSAQGGVCLSVWGMSAQGVSAQGGVCPGAVCLEGACLSARGGVYLPHPVDRILDTRL